MSYTAANIKVLTPGEASERFFYVSVDDLAQKYTHVSREFIARLLEACELSCFPVRDAVRRYLDGDESVKVSPELIETHRDLAQRNRLR